MKLYNIITNEIENIRGLEINGILVNISSVAEHVLNKRGYYSIVFNSLPDTRYYSYVRSESLIGIKYTISYAAVEKSLEEVIARMLKTLRKKYEDVSLRPKVDTGLGYFVYGGSDDINELIIWKDYAETEIFDAYGNIQSVTGASYTAIASAIKNNRQRLFREAKTKVSEIKALASIDECITYEHSPYDTVEEIVDDFGEPTGEGTHTVTRYINNVLDWE